MLNSEPREDPLKIEVLQTKINKNSWEARALTEGFKVTIGLIKRKPRWLSEFGKEL